MVDVPLMMHKPPQRGAPRQLDIATGCMRVGRRCCCCCCYWQWQNPNKIFGNFCLVSCWSHIHSVLELLKRVKMAFHGTVIKELDIVLTMHPEISS